MMLTRVVKARMIPMSKTISEKGFVKSPNGSFRTKIFKIDTHFVFVVAMWLAVVLICAVVIVNFDDMANQPHTVTFENSSWYMFGGQWFLNVYKIEGSVIHLSGSYTANSSGIINVTLKGNISTYMYVAEYSVTLTANVTFNSYAHGIIDSEFIPLEFNSSVNPITLSNPTALQVLGNSFLSFPTGQVN